MMRLLRTTGGCFVLAPLAGLVLALLCAGCATHHALAPLPLESVPQEWLDAAAASRRLPDASRLPPPATGTAALGPRVPVAATPTSALPAPVSGPTGVAALPNAKPSCDPACPPRACLPAWPTPPCRTAYLDAAISAIPNAGFALGAGWIFSTSDTRTHALEVQGTYQFLDDEDFIDDGNPGAGDWLQLRAGLKTSLAPRARRHVTLRGGAVWLRAEGEPNIVQDSGDYAGLYGGIGFEAGVTSCLTVGPELSVLMLLTKDGEFEVNPVPQLSWHVVWWPGGGGRAVPRAPIGELYVGAGMTLSPGIGAGGVFGQVFRRSTIATWSFEGMVGLQAASDALWFDEDGDFAQIRGGLKATFQPGCRGHWTARAGLTWLRSTADSAFLDRTGDHVGAYVGVGYEFDLSRRFTTGPEISLSAVARESRRSVELVPQLHWHFILKL